MFVFSSIILFIAGLFITVFTRRKLLGLTLLTLAAAAWGYTWVELSEAAKEAGNKYVFINFIRDCLYKLCNLT